MPLIGSDGAIIAPMKTEDPDKERQRLMELYSCMADGELEGLAEDPTSLTEVARQTLGAELDRRGLSAVSKDIPPATDAIELRELVTIRKFRDLHEALLAKGLLESSGIKCSLFDDNMVALDWLASTALGGIKLQVSPEDAEAATKLLPPIPGDSEIEDQWHWRSDALRRES